MKEEEEEEKRGGGGKKGEGEGKGEGENIYFSFKDITLLITLTESFVPGVTIKRCSSVVQGIKILIGPFSDLSFKPLSMCSWAGI